MVEGTPDDEWLQGATVESRLSATLSNGSWGIVTRTWRWRPGSCHDRWGGDRANANGPGAAPFLRCSAHHASGRRALARGLRRHGARV